MRNKYLKTIILLILTSYVSYSNNLKINDVTVIDNENLSFEISWDNSWNLENLRPPYNYDAVWIFLKYRKNDEIWKHLDLNNHENNFEISDTNLLQIETVEDKKGIFVRRKNIGSGFIPPIKIKLNFAKALPPGKYSFKVIGIEMVKIPKSFFYLGDTRSCNTLRRGDKNLPFFVASEDEIKVGKDSNSLFNKGLYAPTHPIPASFPKGYNGFYCMKYEISQEQYADFLNTLTYKQQKNLTFIRPNSNTGKYIVFSDGNFYSRNSIIISKSGIDSILPASYSCNYNKNNTYNEVNDGQNIAMNFVNWSILTSYLDWAALRPLSELEFEKVCRGPEYPVSGEFAWGTAFVVDANQLTKAGKVDERVLDTIPVGFGLANHGYEGVQGPLRCGFGGSDTSNRWLIGAGYYGVLEMSGNLWELCVNVSKSGLKFGGEKGDGMLNSEGYANVLNWPQNDGRGAGYRGGAWNSGISVKFRDLAISDRFYIFLKPIMSRNTSGGRGGR